jgi:hypothetical protein
MYAALATPFQKRGRRSRGFHDISSFALILGKLIVGTNYCDDVDAGFSFW